MDVELHADFGGEDEALQLLRSYTDGCSGVTVCRQSGVKGCGGGGGGKGEGMFEKAT